MARSKRIQWADLDPPLRAELEAILAAHRRREAPLGERFHSDADEFMPFVLLAFLAAVGGAVACLYLILSDSTDPRGLGRRLLDLAPYPAAWFRSIDAVLIACALAAAALAVFWLRHRGRRGFAITERALVIVRGPRLRVLPFADIAASTQTPGGYRGQRFTVLDLTMHDGRHEKLIVTKNWADAVEAAIVGVEAV